jgi:transposase-like protein
MKDKRFGCRRCRYKFGEFTGTYIGESNFSLDKLAHLTYLFALGVPAYRIRFYYRHRKGKRGWGSEGKNLVFGIYQRNGKVITFPVSDRKHKTLIPFIKLHTEKGSLYYTDDHTAYAALNLIGKHQIILHGKEEYVRDDATHINGIEGFWELCQDMAISLQRCTQIIL